MMKTFIEFLDENHPVEEGWAKNLALGAGLATSLGFGGQAKSSEIQSVTPSQYSQRTDGVETTSKLNQFWKNLGNGKFKPLRGNSVLIKHGMASAGDNITGSHIDFSFYNQPHQADFALISSEGRGLTEEQAILDALAKAGSQHTGGRISGNTQITNDIITKDQTSVTGNAIIYDFKVLSVDQSNKIFTARIAANVSVAQGRSSGIENHKRLDNNGNFRTFKQTIR